MFSYKLFWKTLYIMLAFSRDFFKKWFFFNLNKYNEHSFFIEKYKYTTIFTTNFIIRVKTENKGHILLL